MYCVITILHKVCIVLYAQLLYSIAQLWRNVQSYDSCTVTTTSHSPCFMYILGLTDIIEFICILSMTDNN